MSAPVSSIAPPPATDTAAFAACQVPEARGKVAEHNAAIDSMRGIAALMVVFFHMEFWGFPIVPGRVAFLGALGVNLFFTLSGFLIARAVLTPARFDRSKYLKNRSLRILPNYYICCLLGLFLFNGKSITHSTGGQLAFDLGTHALLLHSWFGSTTYSINSPLWTLGHEWMFYLLIGLAAPLLRSSRGWLLPLAMGFIAIAAKYLVATRLWQSTTGRSNPLCLWDQFAIGITGALLVAASAGWRSRGFRIGIAGVCGLLLVVACLYWQYAAAGAEHLTKVAQPGRGVGNDYAALFYMKRSNLVWFPVVFSVGVSLMLVGVTSGFQTVNRWLGRTPLPWMGKVSYSTYLYHMPVLLCLERGFSSAPAGSLFATHGAAACVAALVGTFSISAFAFHFFEQPWLARKSRTSVP